MTDAAISALGAVARHLAWPQYSQLLNQWIRHMAGKPGKAVIRAVCAILDSFHFSLPDQLLVEIKARQTAKEQEELLQQQGMADKEAGLEDEETQGRLISFHAIAWVLSIGLCPVKLAVVPAEMYFILGYLVCTDIDVL